MIEPELNKIIEKREVLGISWKDLATHLPISGNALRISFTRNSVKPSYLKVIQEYLYQAELKSFGGSSLPKPKALEAKGPATSLTIREISKLIIEKESEFLKEPIFKLWLSTKVNQGVLEYMKSNPKG